MAFLTCRKCNGNLEFDGTYFVCTGCGEKYLPQSTGLSNDGEEKEPIIPATPVEEKNNNKYLIAIISIVVATVVAVAGIVIASIVMNGNNNDENESSSQNVIVDGEEDDDKDDKEDEDDTEEEDDGFLDSFNILFIGRDKVSRVADTIIVLEIRENILQGTWVPRDSLFGDKKISTISGESNGISKVQELLEDKLSLSIDYYVEMDMSDIEDMIDALGGVKFNVPRNMKYEDPEQGLYIDLQSGTQILNGDEACQLLQFRSYSSGDLERIKTQQSFIKAVIDQHLSKRNMENIVDIVSACYKNIKTDYKLDSLMHDLLLLNNIDYENIVFKTISGRVDTYDGMSVYKIY